MSALPWLRFSPSTYSYLNPTVMLWAPLFPVGTTCMGTAWVWLAPADRPL